MAVKDYGYFGPNYSVNDDIKLPGELGVKKDSTFQAIIDSVGGINYYLDTIAFGTATGFDKGDPYPLGIRYYLDSGLRCSNGATMNEYVDGITKGDLLGKRVADGLASAKLPGLRGLAPGMLENARDALDPRPIFAAVTGTGYPVCQQVLCPVGTGQGKIVNSDTPTKPFIIGPVTYSNGLAYQQRWVQGYTEDGTAISISKDEFQAAPKCYNADGSYMAQPPEGCPATEEKIIGGWPNGSKYDKCILMRPVSLPPTMQMEGFQNVDVSAIVLLVTVAGLAVWALIRKR